MGSSFWLSSQWAVGERRAGDHPTPAREAKASGFRFTFQGTEGRIPAAQSRPGFANITLLSKRAQGMPGDGLTHGPPATKKQAAVTTGLAGSTAFPAQGRLLLQNL
jgi:hypothetical protein